MDAVERVERQLLLDLRELLNKAPISLDPDTDWLTLDSLRVFLDRIDAALSLARSNGWQDILEQAAKIAESHANCGCNGAHGACMIDDTPKAIAEEIRALDRLGGSED